MFKTKHLLVLAASVCGSFLNADTTIKQFSLSDKEVSELHFSEINSTQLFSRKNVKINPLRLNNWILISADKQVTGVGSHSRKWISDEVGNVYATLNFPIKIDNAKGFERIRNVFSLAVLETMKDFLPNNEISYKWPNDVLVNGKKISGVLCEYYSTSEKNIYHVIVGIGININLSKEKLEKIDQPATSMVVEGGVDLSVDEITRHVISKAIELGLKDALTVKDELQEHFSLLGEVVVVHDDATGEDICGILLGVGEDGSLLLKVGDEVRSVLNGTVVKKQD